MQLVKLGVLLLTTHLALGSRLLHQSSSAQGAAHIAVETAAAAPAGAANYSHHPSSHSLIAGRTVKSSTSGDEQDAQSNAWQLLWSDEFDGTELNTDWWSYDVGPGSAFGNNEQQIFTAGSNVAVVDGKLSITARQEPSTGEWPVYTSARINTKGKASWGPGMVVGGTVMKKIRVDISAKVPAGQGFWCAMWMLPDGYPGNEGAYGTWPSSGEIDIMETINQADTLYGHIHYGGWISDAPPYIHKSAGVRRDSVFLASDYHVFSIEWSEDHINWYLDGQPYGSAASAAISPEWGWFTTNRGLPGSPSVPPEEFAQRPHAPFDQKFYLIINLSIGGGWPGPPDETTPFPSNLLVDWVRVAGQKAQ